MLIKETLRCEIFDAHQLASLDVVLGLYLDGTSEKAIVEYQIKLEDPNGTGGLTIVANDKGKIIFEGKIPLGLIPFLITYLQRFAHLGYPTPRDAPF